MVHWFLLTDGALVLLTDGALVLLTDGALVLVDRWCIGSCWTVQVHILKHGLVI